MRNVAIFILVFLFGCTPEPDGKSSIRTELLDLLKPHADCEYRFSVIKIGDFQDSTKEINYSQQITFIGEPGSFDSIKALKLCTMYSSAAYPVLIEMMKKGEYKWTCNLLLYTMTGRKADSMVKYMPDKCDQWLNEGYQKDLQYWESATFTKKN